LSFIKEEDMSDPEPTQIESKDDDEEQKGLCLDSFVEECRCYDAIN